MDTPADWSLDYAKDIFWGRIEAEMEVIRDFNIGNIDMVFYDLNIFVRILLSVILNRFYNDINYFI